MKKFYYQLTFMQNSPLRIGATTSSNSDSDVVLDSRGIPFIPGSTIAGILRSMFEESQAKTIFGDVDIATGNSYGSQVIVSDAVIVGDVDKNRINISIRDGVELNDRGTNVSSGKYDYEVVETGYTYISVIEWNGNDNELVEKVFEPVIKEIVQNGIHVGAKTTRGFGDISISAKKISFELPTEIDNWLEFNPFKAKAFENAENVEGASSDEFNTDIKIDFCIDGNFTIRVNSSDYIAIEDGTTPDSTPLFNIKNKPVIPGTSWAGCFRHHMRNVVNQIDGIDSDVKEKIDEVFGKSNIDGNHKKSNIYFSESSISNGQKLVVTRNAVDRFTQAPVNTGLFTNMVWYGGEGTLTIKIKKDSVSKLFRQLLATAIIDMSMGIMGFGGETSVGRGRAKITKVTVNGQDKTSDVECLNTSFLEV